MDLSVIIVSYNEFNYLSKCIESCLMQKFNGKMEIIICDDGSNDGSLELIRSYASCYPDLIKYHIVDRDPKLKKNDVIASLRASNLVKIGLEIATGEYNIAISGDDYFINENIFQQQFDFLNNHPKLVACYSNFKWLNSDGSYFETNHKKLNRPAFWSHYYTHLTTFMFRKKCKCNILCRISDDVGLIYSIILSGKISYFPKTSFIYNCRRDSITQSYKYLEGHIGEVLLLQDILNSKIYFGTFSRFKKSITTLFEKRRRINSKDVKKYIAESQKYKNDILNLIINYDSNPIFLKIKMRLLLLRAASSYIIYKCINVMMFK